MPRPVRFILAPLDQGTRNVGGREGSCDAPERILLALGDAGLIPNDADETRLPMGNTAATLEADLHVLSDAVQRALADGRLPIVLGGDHGTTYATVRGLARVGARSPAVAYLDVHFDMRPFAPVHTSGSSFRRLIEEGIVAPERLHPLGILRPGDPAARVRSRFKELAAWADARGVPWVPLDRLHTDGVASTLARRMQADGPWALSFDVDCLDAKWAPGVSAPGTGRMGLDEVVAAVQRAAPRVDVFDVVEFVPRLDEADATLTSIVAVVRAFLAARAGPF